MFARLTLRRRIVLFSLMILIAGLGIFSWLGVQSANDSTSRTLDERLIIARLAASRLDETLQYAVVQLQSTASSTDLLQSQAKFNSIAVVLQESLNRSGVSAKNIIAVDASGGTLFVEPAGAGLAGLNLSDYSSVKQVLSDGAAAISGLVSIPQIPKPVILISVPLFGPAGDIRGALVCTVDMDQSISGNFSKTLVLGNTGYTEIVDENGVVIARTSPGSPLKTFEMSDHPGRFAALISQGKATVGTCHRCHESQGNVVRNKDVLAFAPLSVASWGVAVRQPEEEALAPTWELEKKLAIFGIILAGCTVLLVLVMMRGIVGPIRLLTSAARKIAVGDMETAIPVERKDEIGELSNAFQSMRQEIAKSRKEMDSRYIAARDKGETRGGLLNNVISAQEEERQRIARDLHDDSIQSLILVCRQLDSIGENGDGSEHKSDARIQSARKTVESTITGLRSIIKALRPPILDDLGLLASIRRILRDFQERTGIEARFELVGEDRRLPPEIELGIFRIANEAIWNAEHHSKATAAKLSVWLSDAEIKLEVQDNGVGFAVPPSLDDFSSRGKFGLLGMRERVELLGGKLEVDSAPSRGTRVTVRVSLPHP